MSIVVSWETEKQTTIVITFDRPWTWEEFRKSYDDMDKLFKSVSHEVDLILDITEGGFPPAGAVQEFRRVSEIQHPNLGKIAVVGIPTFFRGMLNILKTVYKGRYEAPDFLFAPSLEEAHKMMARPVPGDTVGG
jgi:hypothetical protein